MLQAFGLSFEPSPLVGPLFTDLRISVDAGETVVLMGKNGTGKTKLLEILAGRFQPSAGRVVRDSRCRIGYLPQDIDLDFAGSLREFLEVGESDAEGALMRSCAQMGIDPESLDLDYSRLSVGERIRASIARLLIDEPTVLLLDEPTNHLDVGGRTWLCDFLERSRLACLMVSHDRAVINRIANRVLVLDDGRLSEYSGGYDEMIQARELQEDRQRATYARQVAEERRLKAAAEKMSQNAARMMKKRPGKVIDKGAMGFYTAKEARMQSRASAVKARVAQAVQSRIDKPHEDESVAISFNTKPLRHSDALSVRKLSKSFAGKELFSDLSFTLGPGERIALAGANGAGKTTLMRILLGEELPDGGEVAWSPDAQPAFLSQERNSLDLDANLLDALAPVGPEQSHFVRTLLARLRMRGESAHKPMRALSVGERTKAELVAILMTPANVLLLDEPTNHLDVDSLEALEEALRQFDGSILFTSHDQAFIERVATATISLKPGPMR